MEDQKKSILISKIIKDWDYYLTDEQIRHSIQPFKWNTYEEHEGKVVSFINLAMTLNLPKVFKVLAEKIDEMNAEQYLNLWSVGIVHNSFNCLEILKTANTKLNKPEMKDGLVKKLSESIFQKKENKKSLETIDWVFNNFPVDQEIKNDLKKNNELVQGKERSWNNKVEISFQESLTGGLLEKSIKNKNISLINKIFDLGYVPNSYFYQSLLEGGNYKLVYDCLANPKVSKEKLDFNKIFNVLIAVSKSSVISKEAAEVNYFNKNFDIVFNELSKTKMVSPQNKFSRKQEILTEKTIKDLINYSIKCQSYSVLQNAKKIFHFSTGEHIDPFTVYELLNKKTEVLRSFVKEVVEDNVKGQHLFVKYFLEKLSDETKGEEQKNKLKKLLALTKTYPWIKDNIVLEIPLSKNPLLVAEIQKNLLNMELLPPPKPSKMKML